MRFNVFAIDGPTAAGKGTLAKKLAIHLAIPYLNTGALYRAVGYNLIKNNFRDFNDKEKIISIAEYSDFSNLERAELYTEDVGFAASKIATIQEVRDFLFHFQQKFSNNSAGAILDGRDIGTVICPDAEFKFFITASAEIRARRRFEELTKKGIFATYEEILAQLIDRDKRDKERLISPLIPAEDAVIIDTSGLDIEESFAKILSYVTVF